jgi:hypothetical protein
MFASGPDRGPPSTLRGWLSDVYLPALLDVSMRDRAIESLAGRLGAKAVIDDPLHGRAVGLPAINEHLKKTAEWLSAHSASYERVAFTTGIDRDVTEGILSLEFESKTVDLPVAVVAERRRSREVELRVYHAVQTILQGKRARAQLVAPVSDLVLPPPLAVFLDALARGDTKAAAAAFESDGSIRDARGLQHGRKDGELEGFVDGLVAGGAFGGGLELSPGGLADDGRTCALEYALVRARGRDVDAQAGLMMFERGDTGLLRTVRVYGELES